MHRALELAARGKGRVSPNPCVGCVIVKKGKMVGEGYHQRFGGPHAEVLALNEAGRNARQATAYVTLEPCNHWGKTPPCVPQLVNAGIKQVYIAMKDPNPIVAGRGIRALKKAGIRVQSGMEEKAAATLNRSYITWMKRKRPHTVAKMALTLDGKSATASGESKWISGEASRRLVHKLRAESDAVLIGANTANRDNPSLTSHGAGRNPLRIILDPHLRTKKSLRVYRDRQAKTLVVVDPSKSFSRERELQKRGVQILRTSLRFNRVNLLQLLKNISKINVSQLFIEGGGETIWPFIEHGLLDEIYFFIAPKILGGRSALTPVEGTGFKKIAQALKLRDVSVSRSGEDILVHALAGKN